MLKEEDVDLYRTLIRAEDMMYENKLLNKDSLRSKIVSSLQASLYEKSYEAEEHALRVAKYGEIIARKINLSQNEINNVILLCKLHDIGKISIDDFILHKPGKLNAEEWRKIKKHPETGYRILSKAPGMQDASNYILAHHERWDGKGYPNGIGTYDIPLQARIIAIADAFDAMRSKRPYRDPLPLDIVVSEIKKGAGTQFDPELAKVFVIEVLKKEW